MMNKKEQGFVFIKDKCIQCSGCETACKSWNSLSHGLGYRKVFNIWEGVYPEIKSNTLSISCLHCIEPECEKVCPTDAITKNMENGIVSVDDSLCIGCKLCFDACPYDIPEFDYDGIMKKCQMCGDKPACVLSCPTGALELKHMDINEKREIEKLNFIEFNKINA